MREPHRFPVGARAVRGWRTLPRPALGAAGPAGTDRGPWDDEEIL